MRTCVIHNAAALALAAMVGFAPAIAAPVVEQRSAVSDNATMLDSTDYGPSSYSSTPASGGSIYGPTSGSQPAPTTPPRYTQPRSSSGAATAPASGQWEIYRQLQQLQDEVQQLRGMVERQNFEIEQIRKQQRDTYRDLDMRINQGSGSAAGGTTGEPAANAGLSDSAKPVANGAGSVIGSANGQLNPATEEEKRAYTLALDNVKSKQYQKAISQLESLLTTAPNSQIVPNAHYWLGELYMVAQPTDLDRAKAHFQELLKYYADNPKVPDALFKLGKLSALRGENDRAKLYFNRVIKEFPDTQAATLAKDYLRRP
ncbi:Conserved hypothetical protein [gamma proteobacterium HdN1]|nr:Conserved hypothetical protein [gamma proteobacterium HdN1]